MRFVDFHSLITLPSRAFERLSGIDRHTIAVPRRPKEGTRLSKSEMRILAVAVTWVVVAAMLATFSVVAGGRLSTAALIFVICLAPWGFAFIIGGGAPPLTVAELLHVVDTQNGRGR
jgi:hypothetical protein